MDYKLSVITVNYNDKNGLQKTIESVKQQSWQNFEFIVIDGGSTDGSKEIVDQYKNLFAYFISEPDNGVYNAMNKGIKQAKGEYLIFLNSGDILNSGTTLLEIEPYLNGKKDILYGDANYQEKAGDVLRTYPDKLTFGFFLEHNLSHQAAFIKRKLFDDIFFYNENYKIASDWEFFIYAICNRNVSYEHIDLVICKYDTSGISSLTDNHKLMHRERIQTIERFFPSFVDDYKGLSETKSKRFKQFLFIKEHKISFKLLKGFMSILLFFLPKSKIN